MRDKKKPHTNILYIQGTKLNKIAENMQQFVDLWGCKHITDILLQVKSWAISSPFTPTLIYIYNQVFVQLKNVTPISNCF